jgi:hypothetical protein
MDMSTIYKRRAERVTGTTNGAIKAKGGRSYKKEGTGVVEYRKTAFFAL